MDHLQECRKAITWRDALYGRDQADVTAEAEARAMSEYLSEVEPSEILPLMRRTVQGKGSEFPPRAVSLLKHREGEDMIARMREATATYAAKELSDEEKTQKWLAENFRGLDVIRWQDPPPHSAWMLNKLCTEGVIEQVPGEPKVWRRVKGLSP